MDGPYDEALEVAVRAVRLASIACRNVGAAITPEARAKKDKSPVTVADYASQAIICREIASVFPRDEIVAEEDSGELRLDGKAGLLDRVVEEVGRIVPGAAAESTTHWIDLGGAEGAARRFWTLDPIDGTKGFLRGEQYAVALALVVDGRVQVAVLGCPNLNLRGEGPGVLMTSVRGSVTRVMALESESEGAEVSVSTVDRPAEARFCESVESGHSDHAESSRIATRLGFAGVPRRLDSQAKYAVVAAGEAEVYLRLPTLADYREKIWDHAAGSLIIECAGGRVTDVDGKPLDFSRGRELTENRGIVATNGRLHDRVLAAIAVRGS